MQFQLFNNNNKNEGEKDYKFHIAPNAHTKQGSNILKSRKLNYMSIKRLTINQSLVLSENLNANEIACSGS